MRPNTSCHKYSGTSSYDHPVYTTTPLVRPLDQYAKNTSFMYKMIKHSEDKRNLINHKYIALNQLNGEFIGLQPAKRKCKLTLKRF
jgi:hypothetical protein